jgi:hypothetical protein
MITDGNSLWVLAALTKSSYDCSKYSTNAAYIKCTDAAVRYTNLVLFTYVIWTGGIVLVIHGFLMMF